MTVFVWTHLERGVRIVINRLEGLFSRIMQISEGVLWEDDKGSSIESRDSGCSM